MELHTKKFAKRTGMSEAAIANRVVVLCYVICAVALSILGPRTYYFGESVALNIKSAICYLLLWTPCLIGKLFFYRFDHNKKTMRLFLFGGFIAFYGFILITDSIPQCSLIAVPYLILTITYGNHNFSMWTSAVTTLLAGLYAAFGPYMGDVQTRMERIYSFLVILATALLLNIMVRVIEDAQFRRRQQLEAERNRLKSLVAVGINRIFEYDLEKDVMMIARSKDGDYGDERYIENFSESAKTYRYVLFADWDKFDSFLDDCKWGNNLIERQMRLRDRNGDYKWYTIKGRTIFGEGHRPEKVIGFMENIDEIKRMELRQADENKRDILTKLYRFDYSKELIENFIEEQADNYKAEYAGLLVLDIDNFDILNDRMGRSFGDEILKNIASDLEGIFYSSDVLGRVGGDEFVILMKNIKDVNDIDKKIREIQKVINRTYVGENVSFGSTVGIGAAIYPTDGENFDILFDKAEKALYHAKSVGKNCYGFYTPAKEQVYSQYPIEERREKIARAELEMSSRYSASDSLIELAFKLIDESKDTDSAINLLIRQVSRQMNLGGIRIKSRIGKEYKMVSLYECTNDSDMEFENSDLTYTMTQWADLLEEYHNHNNLVAYDNVMEIENGLTRQLMLSMGARAYVGCAFYDKGEFAGNIDFVDFDKSRNWTQDDFVAIRAVTNVVSSYLLKMKAYEDASDTVERLTGYDGVTGLLMYEKFLTQCGEYIEVAPHGKYAMIYMDFSNFKYVNETYGYETGDKILRSLAEEVQSYKDSFIFGSRVFSDNIVVFARLGEYEEDELLTMFIRLSKKFSDRVQLEYIDSKLLLDIGVCTFEICGRPVPLKNIISNANMARKKTKVPDSPRCIIYSDDMGEEMKAEISYANDMENAFKNHEFVVYMQPKVNLENNDIEGAEALIRWKKQDGTLIFPNDFIPVFEKNKSITLLDYYVYDEVCKYLRERIDQGKKVVRISVNVSRVHLYSIDELVSYIKSLITKYELEPSMLEFELTETVFTDKVDDTIHLMNRLRELGVLISMDDFGSGYSSLNVLTKLPLDVLKLDKEFLDDFENDPEEKIIIPSVIDMAKKLNLKVVCEGVETIEQVAFLRDVGCDYAQGYFYSKPIPREQFDELLEV
ncbi:MAG: EAL domain-containing protein [Lachnospiraceae bacterium]|nr:EAL domain-containing protein [Candidatus Colinaster scatohippi]